MQRRAKFDVDFEEFKQKLHTDDYTFLARPHQDLSTHVVGMLQEMEQYFQDLHPLPEVILPAIQLGTIIAILSHDFGKVLPHFQYKVWIKRSSGGRRYAQLPKALEVLSYHTLASACFAECLCTVLDRVELLGAVWQEYPVKFAIVNAVLGHHSSHIANNFGEMIGIFQDPYILGGNSAWDDIALLFQDELPKHKIEHLFDEIVNSSNILNLGQFNKRWCDFLKTAYETFLEKYTKGEDDIFAPKPPSVQILKLIDVEKENITLEEPHHTYFFSTYLASILCDLDIWDARFFHPVTGLHVIIKQPEKDDLGVMQKIPFFTSLEPLPQDLVQRYINTKYANSNVETANQEHSRGDLVISKLRRELFREVNTHEFKSSRIYSLCSPTGAGKTLTLLNAAVEIAQEYPSPPKIIYCLPFVSIGTQVAQQILDIYSEKEDIANNERLVIDNYLTESYWHFNVEESEAVEGPDAKWLISSWQSQLIVTTFVKLFYTLLKPEKGHYLKMHRLANSILILDEIQCLPIKYWELIRLTLNQLAARFNCTVILSTATQPAIFPTGEVEELAPMHLTTEILLNGTHYALSDAIYRYDLCYFPSRISLPCFLDKIAVYLAANPGVDTLIVLNTRKAAIDALQALEKAKLENTQLYLLSTLVLPLDRKETIRKIKEGLLIECARERIVVISTQVIEAGVDLSFQVVFRDFAPLDSIVQVAGRCNRHFSSESPGRVFIFQLRDPQNNHPYFNYIYGNLVHVATTTDEFLKKTDERITFPGFGEAYVTSEPQIRREFAGYFLALKQRNRSNLLLDSFNKLKFAQLASKFSIIDKLAGQVPLLFLNSPEARTIHERVQQNGYLPNVFYLYTITIPQQEALVLRDHCIIKEFAINNEDGVLYYIIDELHIPEYYKPERGFIAREQDPDQNSIP